MSIELLDEPTTALTVTCSCLRRLLKYDQTSGVFTWIEKSNSSSRVVVGARAGSMAKDGYRYIKIRQVRYSEHRLAWFYMMGEWPLEVDHKDGIGSNNSWSNLRNVTHAINMQNVRTPRKHNSLGSQGVTAHMSKFRARVRFNGKLHHLGLFESPELAHAAYVTAKRQLHEGNTL